jgi:hypothetical protein
MATPLASVGRAFRNYGAGEGFPVGAYPALLGAFGSLLLLSLRAVPPRARTVPELGSSLGGFLMFSAATHKITRILTKSFVTSPLRAPFTRYQGPAGSGETEEVGQGTGLRMAVGDLLTCPYCAGPWVALGLLTARRARPELASRVISLFSAVTVSDFLHFAYEAARAQKDLRVVREEMAEQRLEKARAS